MENLDYGVCRLSVLSVRTEPSDKAEQATQLLFGDHYEVIDRSKDNKWLRIRIYFDQYEGWIDALQHHAVSKDYIEYLEKSELKITTDLTSSLLYNKSPLAILMGSMIPISSSELFKMEEQFAFNGESKNVGQKREFEFLRNVAVKYINAPYQWGGKSPFGIDCSGFTQMVFKICGYKLLRDSSQQANQGKSVKEFSQAKPGDLAFFKNAEDKVTHVGILLAEEKIIHASGRVRIDHLTAEGIVNGETKNLSHTLSHVRRILAE
ncbi:C40 family peptidase [Ohtaekwangia sp.]|uniref:C40 family peptidase n=1 Tax=Ohtaekwangia sp. TaxID=2066019 RepID=UPI002F9410E2